MEIERKWLIKGWPQMTYPVRNIQQMEQGYINVRPTVRIRKEVSNNGETDYILCFKSAGFLSRKEIEMPISEDMFAQLSDLIGLPLIKKERRTYELPDGLLLEVNHVDEGEPTEFWYAEIEFASEEQATAWKPEGGLAQYLANEVTTVPGSTMGAYWLRTRLKEGEDYSEEQ